MPQLPQSPYQPVAPVLGGVLGAAGQPAIPQIQLLLQALQRMYGQQPSSLGIGNVNGTIPAGTMPLQWQSPSSTTAIRG